MNLDRVGSGKNVPDDINVIIEIPSHSDPVKYEVDKETGAMFVDRFMNTAMHYPCNYGYVPHTLSEDGDPVDVLVITPIPLISGSVIRCRPVGVLKMTDEAGPDAKVLAVPIDKLCQSYRKVMSPEDVSPIRSSTSSSTTRIWKKANGSRSKAGPASMQLNRRYSTLSSATTRRLKNPVSKPLRQTHESLYSVGQSRQPLPIGRVPRPFCIVGMSSHRPRYAA